MKRSFFIFLLTLFILAGCNRNNLIIPEDDFVDILVDIHLIDGIMGEAAFRDPLLGKYNTDSTNIYSKILENYGYTKAHFDTSMVHYSYHIDEFQKIYEEVLDALHQKEEKYLEGNIDLKNIPVPERQ